MVPLERVLIQDMVHIEDMELFFLRISRMCKTCSLKRENSKNNKHTANIWGMRNNTLAMLSLKQNRVIIIIGKQLE